MQCSYFPMTFTFSPCACWLQTARPSRRRSRPRLCLAAGLRSGSRPAWRRSAAASASIYLQETGQESVSCGTASGRASSGTRPRWEDLLPPHPPTGLGGLTVSFHHLLHGADGVSVGPLLHQRVRNGLQLQTHHRDTRLLRNTQQLTGVHSPQFYFYSSFNHQNHLQVLFRGRNH